MALSVNYTPPRAARALQRLNVRRAADTQTPRVGVLEAGGRFDVDALFSGEELLGDARWLRLAGRNEFVWARAVDLDEPAPAATGAAQQPQVKRRADDTILPIPVVTLGTLFGSFSHAPGTKRGAIAITSPADWRGQHIEDFDHPLLSDLGRRPQPVNRLAARHLRAVFDAIASQGLDRLVLSCEGTWVLRHKNWDPKRELSSHSWGIAIDLNSRFNGVGQPPALPGQIGSVRELVSIFAKHGFAWGGHFSGSSIDGMHFELARTDL